MTWKSSEIQERASPAHIEMLTRAVAFSGQLAYIDHAVLLNRIFRLKKILEGFCVLRGLEEPIEHEGSIIWYSTVCALLEKNPQI